MPLKVQTDGGNYLHFLMCTPLHPITIHHCQCLIQINKLYRPPSTPLKHTSILPPPSGDPNVNVLNVWRMRCWNMFLSKQNHYVLMYSICGKAYRFYRHNSVPQGPIGLTQRKQESPHKRYFKHGTIEVTRPALSLLIDRITLTWTVRPVSEPHRKRCFRIRCSSVFRVSPKVWEQPSLIIRCQNLLMY